MINNKTKRPEPKGRESRDKLYPQNTQVKRPKQEPRSENCETKSIRRIHKLNALNKSRTKWSKREVLSVNKFLLIW